MAYASIYSAPTANLDQRFTYTCLGTEGDSFTIPLPIARADTNYIANVSLLSSASVSQYLCNAPQATYTSTGIGVITGAPVGAGDVLAINIMGVG